MGDLIDFDAFLAEQRAAKGDAGEHPTFKVSGKVYELPAELPAATVLAVVRMRAVGGDEADATLEDIVKIGNDIFGEDAFAEIVRDARLGLSEMGELVKAAIEAYGVSRPVPNRKTRRAKVTST